MYLTSLCLAGVLLPILMREFPAFQLLLYLVVSALITLYWRLWWIGPICGAIGMLVFQVTITDWSSTDLASWLDTEPVMLWGMVIESALSGGIGSLLGHWLARRRRASARPQTPGSA